MQKKVRVMPAGTTGESERTMEIPEPVPPEDFVRMKEWIRLAHSEAERAQEMETQDLDSVFEKTEDP